jgi:hypothetical protein
MTARQGTAAQMSTYPLDVKHVEHLLPHQLRAWGPSVDRFIVTIDTHQTRSGRYAVSNFAANLERLRHLCNEAARSHPKLEVIDVDYSADAQREVARFFFNVDSIPIKAWDGGPFYSYFFGLYHTHAQYVMHFDGDMLFGGQSARWMQESIACIQERSDVLVTAPFPGPPRTDEAIFGHEQVMQGFTPTKETLPQLAYRHQDVSTRAFMIDLNRFKSTLGAFPMSRPSVVQRVKSHLLGHAPLVLPAEWVMSEALRAHGLYRVDLIGSAPGMWSLHPPYRSEEFYRRLPEFIRAVETGNVPEGQRGHYDLNDSMIDWSEARASQRWFRRYLRMLQQRLTFSG